MWNLQNILNVQPAQKIEEIYKKAWQTYHNTEADPKHERREEQKRSAPPIDQNSPEFQAMAVLGLEPPLDLKTIKKRYKELAKKYHPDLNPGDQKAEDILKTINMSYTVLRLSYEKYEKLPGYDPDKK